MFDDSDTPESTTRPPQDSLVEADIDAVRRGDVDFTESKVMQMTEPQRWALFARSMRRAQKERREQGSRMAQIEQNNAFLTSELRANTKATRSGVDWARLSAVVTTLFLAIISSLGDWGHAHPEAKISAALILVAGLFATASKGDKAPPPAMPTASSAAPPPPHS